MRMSITAWDDHEFSTDYVVTEIIGSGNGSPPATPVFIDMGEGQPILAGKTLGGGQFVFRVRLVSGGDDALREQLLDQLHGWFLTSDFTLRKLYATNVDDASEWYLEGFPISGPSLVEGTLEDYSITLALTSPYWLMVDATVDNWNVGSTTEDRTFTNSGNVDALPIFKITPQAAKSSDVYNNRIYRGVYNEWSSFQGPVWVNLFPDGGFDTAAEIAGGQMNEDGNDLKVLVNGTAVPRFFGDIDTDHTNVWVYLDFPKPISYPLYTPAIAGSGAVTSIFMSIPDRTVSPPTNGILKIDNELFTYTSWVYVGSLIRFDGVSRAAKGSSEGAHSVDASIIVIPFDIWVVWGNPSESAPSQDANLEPSFDLVNSDNDSVVYTSFQHLAGTKLTSRGALIARGATYPCAYYGTSETPTSSSLYPLDVIGIKISSYQSGNAVVNNPAKLQWAMFHNGGIAHIVATGKKYRSGALFGTMTLQNSQGSLIHYTETAPSTAAVWEAVSIDTDLSNSPTSVIFQLTGSLGTTLPLPWAAAELSAVTITVEYPVQVFTPTAAEENYMLTGYIEHQSTGYKITFLNLPTKTNVPVYIDCNDQEVYLEDGTRMRGAISIEGPTRDEWMTFQPGDNVLTYYDVDTSDLDIETTYRERNTI